MGKTWNVKVDEQEYQVALLDKGRATVNGSELLLKNCKKKTHATHTEYEIRLGSKTAYLVLLSMGDAQLVIDNKDCETGAAYVAPKMPWWTWIFIILHICMMAVGLTGYVIGGAIGGAFVGVAIVLTMSISSNQKKSVSERIILNIVIFVALFALLYGGRILLVSLF